MGLRATCNSAHPVRSLSPFHRLRPWLGRLLYGRRMYEVMRYWDEDQPGWDEIEHDFAQAWRPKPK
jgi:hypothetical protein